MSTEASDPSLIPEGSGALLQAVTEPQPRPKRLHIVGCPRSGTTLMMELMATCFQNDGFCEHEMSIFTEPPADAALYFSKKPTDIRYVGKLLAGHHDLFVICLYRDPRSIISSVHRGNKGMYFCNYLEWKSCQKEAEALKGHDRYFLVPYEDFTADPNKVQDEIENRFPFLSKKHSFTEYTKVAKPSEKSQNALNGVRPIDTNRHAGWKDHLPRVKAELEKHPELGRELIRLGYEADDSWTQMLEDVTSKDFPCRSAGTTFSLKKLETRVRKHFQTRAYLRRHG